MQTPERHQFQQGQPAQHAGHPANSVLGTLRITGGSKPAGARATYAKILTPALVCLAIWSHIWLGTTAAIACHQRGQLLAALVPHGAIVIICEL